MRINKNFLMNHRNRRRNHRRAIVFESQIILQKQLQKNKVVINDCNVRIVNVHSYSYSFSVVTNSDILLSGDVESAKLCHINLKNFTFYFSIEYQNKLHHFNFVFSSRVSIEAFLKAFYNAIFLEKNQRNSLINDIPVINKNMARYYLRNQNQHQSKYQIQYQDQTSSDTTTEDNDTDDKPNDKGTNFLLLIAPKINSSIVLRKHDEHCHLEFYSNDNKCKFMTFIPQITDEKYNFISASDIITSNSDHGLLVLDKKRPTEIFDMDLDRGQVFSHYNAIDSQNGHHSISHILHSYQNDSSQPIFVGFNEKNTMIFDKRVQNSIVRRTFYSDVDQFTCGTTTKSGRIALGSNDGVVSLYQQPCASRSTVNFNSGSEPITSVDASPNEDWIVATSPTYISLFFVHFSNMQFPFNFPMIEEQMEAVRLQISIADRRYIAQNNNDVLPPFKNARFELNQTGKISRIIASIGNALVSWEFNSILYGRAYKYSINFISNDKIIDHRSLGSNDVLFISQNKVSVISV